MQLTFEKNRFVLEVNPVRAEILRQKNPSWLKLDNSHLETTDIGTAAKFRAVSDAHAEKIFKKIFVQFYDSPGKLPSFLDPHQVKGVNWIMTRSRSYLAHAPGAGKTAQVITAALMTPGTGQTVFVVPPTLTVNWVREILLWSEPHGVFPTISVVPSSLFQDLMGWRAEFIIVPDSMLTKEWVLEGLRKLKIKFIAVDEASRFKESTASRTIALFGGSFKIKPHGVRNPRTLKSPGFIQHARHAVLLDGSPMPNRPMELWAPVYAMAPETIGFMSQDDFGFRYCGPEIDERGHYLFRRSSNEAELKQKLQETFMHVVTEAELSHPERKRAMLFMSSDPRTPAMKAWEQKILKKLRLEDIKDNAVDHDISKYRKILGLTKINWTVTYVQERLEKGESVLLFAWHREVIEKLAERLSAFKPGVVMGGSVAEWRERSFEDFNKGRTKLIIGNIAAMGRGHNLQKANRVIFCEFSWTDELNKQCEKRASRKGSEQDFVRCDYIVAPNTIDETVLNAVFTKARSVKKVIG